MRQIVFGLLVLLLPTLASADGICTPREPTAAEKKDYTTAYALFLKAAPKIPDGWKATDNPPTAALQLCKEYVPDGRIGRNFTRSYELERGIQERQNKAMADIANLAKKNQALQEANKGKIDAVDAKIEALSKKSVALATAQKFAEMEGIAQQQDALLKEKAALMGAAESEAAGERIAAEQNRDASATFQIYFAAPDATPRNGEPYKTVAGRAVNEAYVEKGLAYHSVMIDFDVNAGERATVVVRGDPARVRALLDSADLKAIAAFK